jgi:phosphate-selective porin OprO/OprP
VLNGLGFQIGGSEGQQLGALPSFKTSVGQTYFSYASTASAAGQRRRVSPAVFYYYKSFGAFAEFFRSTQGVVRSGVQTPVTNQAGDISASFVLTGEAASDRGVKPKYNFDPAKGKWGALQLVGRYTALIVDRDAFTAGLAAAAANRRAKSFTVGANWYPNSFIKYYLTYERTLFSGNAVRVPENIILFRTQIAF